MPASDGLFGRYVIMETRRQLAGEPQLDVTRIQLARADIVIRPKVLDMGSTDFTQRAQAIVEGEKATVAAMPKASRLNSLWPEDRPLSVVKAE